MTTVPYRLETIPTDTGRVFRLVGPGCDGREWGGHLEPILAAIVEAMNVAYAEGAKERTER